MKKVFILLMMISVSRIIAQTTHTVGATGADFTTITLALVGASNGDIIEVVDAIHEEAGIQINKNVTVQGLGMNNTIVQAASSEGVATDRVFSVAVGFTATIKDMTIRYGKKHGGLVGSGPSKGGGIFNGETLTLQNVRVSNNQAIGDATDMLAFGGGIYNNGSLTVEQCIIENNYAKAYDDNQRYASGGGIYSYNGTTISIEYSTISSNLAQGADHYYAGMAQGGGVFFDSPSSASILGVTISNNTAQGGNGSSNGGALGGGIIWTNGWVNYLMENSTISGNQALIGNVGAGYGGGIHGTSESVYYLFLQNCTIANNTATSQGGGVFCFSSQKPVRIRDCIIADNAAPSGPDIMNTITPFDYNLIESTSGWSYYAVAGASSVHDITGVDPKLSALSDNNSIYGPQTHHIASDSPAKDAGTSSGASTTDQRGANRNGTVDIGAYEYWDDLGGLPVELTKFSARECNGEIQLNWETATEVNNYGFEVEVSTNSANNSEAERSRSWETIGFVEGHGNSNSPKGYTFIDSDISTQLNALFPVAERSRSYRLKQIDTDGSYEYSNIVTVMLNSPVEYKLSQNYPNPFNPSTIIDFTLPESGDVSLKIYNQIGEEIIELVNSKLVSGFHSVKFNASNLSSGIYFYRIVVRGESSSQMFSETNKMILIK